MEKYQQDALLELLRALNDRNSALGTYFRSISKDAIKDLFKNETVAFLERGIKELIHLEDYEICAAFQELASERKISGDITKEDTFLTSR